jgi:hypothetical protein
MIRPVVKDFLRSSHAVSGSNCIPIVARKRLVKVVTLSKKIRKYLTELSKRLGASENETIRLALMDYAKDLHLIYEAGQSGAKTTER